MHTILKTKKYFYISAFFACLHSKHRGDWWRIQLGTCAGKKETGGGTRFWVLYSFRLFVCSVREYFPKFVERREGEKQGEEFFKRQREIVKNKDSLLFFSGRNFPLVGDRIRRLFVEKRRRKYPTKGKQKAKHHPIGIFEETIFFFEKEIYIFCLQNFRGRERERLEKHR